MSVREKGSHRTDFWTSCPPAWSDPPPLCQVMLDSLLLRVLPAALFGLPFYYLMGLADEPERVAVFFAVLTTFSATAGALSMAASVGCPTAGTANLVMTLLLLTSLVFGGFLANLEVWARWSTLPPSMILWPLHATSTPAYRRCHFR